MWEIKKALVIERKLQGLYPLLPLMEREEQETDEQVMEITIQTIKTVKSPSLQADLLAVMSILVGEKFTSELIKKYIRRDMLMNSPIYNEWVEEERKEATEKASLENSKKKLIELLEGRFDILQLSIRKNIKEIKEESILDELFKKAINIPSVEDFENLLNKAIKMQD